MSNLITHAKTELAAAGVCGSEMDEAMAADVLELLEVFSKQGHSGGSAPYCISLFAKLAAFKPLVPLTGADDEWNEVGAGEFQNRRCGHVFKDSTGYAWDINGIVFREPNGAMYTSMESRVPVTFPYTPRTVYQDVPMFEG